MRPHGIGSAGLRLLLAIPVLAGGTPIALPGQRGAVAPPESVGLSPAALARITPALQAYVDSGKLPGLVALVARHGQVGYLQALGQMDVAQATPMRTDAVFRIYSMTKPVVAVAILKLAEEGRLRPDDPVSRYLPAFAKVRVFAGGSASRPRLRAAERPITLMHLLTHTAGLTYGFFGGTAVDSIYGQANLMGLLEPSATVDQLVDSLAGLPLLFPPGEGWNYSFAIDVLGRVVEVVSGRTLDRYLEDAIFRPLAMRETGFRVRPAMEGRVPVEYAAGSGGRLEAQTPLITGYYQPTSRLLMGGSGLLSTITDYLRFAQMLLNGGELEGARVLSRESVALLMQNHLPPGLTPIESPMVGHAGYGHGLGGVVLVDSARSALPGSPGIYRWWGIAGTFFWVDPKADLVGMVWTQVSPGRTWPVEQDFQRLVYAALMP
jgi:CubicO group peptidase (beta-lactamase class C family)